MKIIILAFYILAFFSDNFLAFANQEILDVNMAKAKLESLDRTPDDLLQIINSIENHYLQKKPAETTAMILLSRTYIEKAKKENDIFNHEDLGKAIYWSTKAIDLAPSLPDGYVIRSLALTFKGDLENSEKDANKAKALNGRYIRGNEAFAELELKKGKHDSSFKYYSAAFALSQETYFKFIYGKKYSKVLFDKGEYFKAIQAFKQIYTPTTKDLEVILNYSFSLAKSKQLDNAVSILKTAVAHNSADIIKKELHRISLIKVKELFLKGELEASKDFCLNVINTASSPGCFYFIGAVLLKENKTEESEEYFIKGLALEEKKKNINSAKAIILSYLDEYQMAAPFFEKSFVEEKDDEIKVELLNDYATYLFVKKTQPENAKKFFEQASALNSQDPYTYYYLGHIKNMIWGMHEESFVDYTQAKEFNKNPELRQKISYEVAYAHYQLGEKKWNKLYIEKALELFRRHTALYPKDSHARNELTKIEALEIEIKSGIVGKIKKIIRDINKKIFSE